MSIIVIKITSSKNKFGVFFAHLDYTLLQSLRKVNLDSISRKKKCHGQKSYFHQHA